MAKRRSCPIAFYDTYPIWRWEKQLSLKIWTLKEYSEFVSSLQLCLSSRFSAVRVIGVEEGDIQFVRAALSAALLIASKQEIYELINGDAITLGDPGEQRFDELAVTLSRPLEDIRAQEKFLYCELLKYTAPDPRIPPSVSQRRDFTNKENRLILRAMFMLCDVDGTRCISSDRAIKTLRRSAIFRQQEDTDAELEQLVKGAKAFLYAYTESVSKPEDTVRTYFQYFKEGFQNPEKRVQKSTLREQLPDTVGTTRRSNNRGQRDVDRIGKAISLTTAFGRSTKLIEVSNHIYIWLERWNRQECNDDLGM